MAEAESCGSGSQSGRDWPWGLGDTLLCGPLLLTCDDIQQSAGPGSGSLNPVPECVGGFQEDAPVPGEVWGSPPQLARDYLCSDPTCCIG